MLPRGQRRRQRYAASSIFVLLPESRFDSREMAGVDSVDKNFIIQSQPARADSSLGGALCLFYLLELALPEHLGFPFAYALAGVAVIGMVSGYSLAILRRASRGAFGARCPAPRMRHLGGRGRRRRQ